MRWVYLHLLFIALPVQQTAAEERCQVIFVNRGGRDLRVSWIGRSGETKFIADVRPGEKHLEGSFCGHHFQLFMLELPPAIITLKAPGRAVIRDENNAIVVERTGALWDEKLSGHGWPATIAKMRSECRNIFDGYPDDVSYFCDPKFDHRVYVESRQVYTDDVWQRGIAKENRGRVSKFQHQPRTLTNFTNVGFEVRKLPKDLLTELQDFHRTSRLSKATPEDRPVFDPNLSGRESDAWLLEVPRHLKEKLRDHFRVTLAEWSGVSEEKLKHTALYGMRLYHNGSRLEMHVDRRDTHVLSAIVEVDHLGLQYMEEDPENWPLQILDHSGQRHFVPSNPGQVILYESATCAHGRPGVFHGREFANLFVHFAPEGWPKDYEVHARRFRDEV